jgi:hypothetical protein
VTSRILTFEVPTFKILFLLISRLAIVRFQELNYTNVVIDLNLIYCPILLEADNYTRTGTSHCLIQRHPTKGKVKLVAKSGTSLT